MKQVYIIDFSNFAYKFKSVYTYAKQNVNGVTIDTSVLVGFIRCLKANLAEDIIIVLDGVPEQSKKVLPSYKGQRMHDDLSLSIGVPKLEVVKFLTKIGSLIGKNIKVVCSPGQETDEVVSSIVHHITGNLPPRATFIDKLNSRELSSDRMLKYLDNDKVKLDKYIPDATEAVIASTDGDFIQLQRWEGVYIDTSSSGKEISHCRTSKSTSGLTPIASIAYKAIYGDVSDNIPANKIPWKKEEVVAKLNAKIRTEKDLDTFYKACISGSQSSINELSTYIYKTCQKQFMINWIVAFLTFRSYPYIVTYPDYDIHETISRYKLKV